VATETIFESDLEQNGAGFTYFRRHASSLDLRLLQLVFGSLAAFSLLVAVLFAAAGAWMIIPFAGLEIAGLAMAAWVMFRRAGDFERLAMSGDRILFEFRELGQVRQMEFNRCWARLICDGTGGLALRSHGREVSVGRYCGEESRRLLERELRSRLAGGRY